MRKNIFWVKDFDQRPTMYKLLVMFLLSALTYADLFSDLDQDEDGGITYYEFRDFSKPYAKVISYSLGLEEFKTMFNEKKDPKSSFPAESTFEKLDTNMDLVLDLKDLDAIFYVVDRDHNSKVDVQEFNAFTSYFITKEETPSEGGKKESIRI
ncbi:uncharacterized protein LOC131950449 [Physella acuta]|uniref:uncharacterized protein LOC131950449 n=1 Tax=Physella acuta TaxID=109671 RepID=UPI0027DDC8D3|nr:uncharacterized protein LOC131950449 [Physella acuta]